MTFAIWPKIPLKTFKNYMCIVPDGTKVQCYLQIYTVGYVHKMSSAGPVRRQLASNLIFSFSSLFFSLACSLLLHWLRRWTINPLSSPVEWFPFILLLLIVFIITVHKSETRGNVNVTGHKGTT